MALTKIKADGLTADLIDETKLADDSIDSEHYNDGSIDTAHLADDAVTAAKIADDAVTGSHIADSAINNTALIADNVVSTNKLTNGTSSNDGKFLRANNGAAPTFETVTQTTINNNADNRIITGSDTANTLGGEGNLTFDGTTLSHGTGGLHNGQKLQILGSGNSTGDDLTINNWGNSDGDYWTIGVNCTANSGGSLSKTNDALRHSAIIMDGRMGRIIFNASETSTSTRTDTFTFNRNGDLDLTGNIVPVNGKGIDFSAQTASSATGASATSELLNHYEYGTFTPTYSGTWTNISNSDNRQARYTRIGNVVHIWLEYFMTGNNGEYSDGSEIRGFPYSSGLSQLYVPPSIGVMYGPNNYSMDSAASGRIYFDAYAGHLVFKMGDYDGIRHIWIQLTYTTG